MARKKMLGVTVIDVAEVALDTDGLKRRWLGRSLPGLTKEGVVRYVVLLFIILCIYIFITILLYLVFIIFLDI